MNLRALLMLATLLLQAGLGPLCQGANAAPEKQACQQGCCARLNDDACACAAQHEAPGRAPLPSAPAPASSRDLVPQVFWTMDSTADFAVLLAASNAAQPGFPADCEGTQHGRHVPLTVLHCSFLH